MNAATQQVWNEGAARANAAYQMGRRRFTIDPLSSGGWIRHIPRWGPTTLKPKNALSDVSS